MSRIRDVPYAYGPIYAYRTEQWYFVFCGYPHVNTKCTRWLHKTFNPIILDTTTNKTTQQQSLTVGTLPSVWKHAYVSPIFKKGNKSDPKNYQPVSLTSLICKMMEHILVSQIMKHLQSYNILSEVQCGFRPYHSCEAQLLLTTDDLVNVIDNKLQMDIAILDFSKAFDKVAHTRLINKLKSYGIRGEILSWIISFLSNRTQQVVASGIQSLSCSVSSGVP